MTRVYPILLTYTEENILVEVPDFDILTEGKSMDNAIDMARDAIELKCATMEGDHESIPEPSSIEEIDLEKGTFKDIGRTVISHVVANVKA